MLVNKSSCEGVLQVDPAGLQKIAVIWLSTVLAVQPQIEIFIVFENLGENILSIELNRSFCPGSE